MQKKNLARHHLPVTFFQHKNHLRGDVIYNNSSPTSGMKFETGIKAWLGCGKKQLSDLYGMHLNILNVGTMKLWHLACDYVSVTLRAMLLKVRQSVHCATTICQSCCYSCFLVVL